MEFVNENGLEALTVRALGDQMGMHFTAVYRHYPNKDALLAAMINQVLQQAVDELADETAPPEERILTLGLCVRRALAGNPALSEAAISTDGDYPSVRDLSGHLTKALSQMGLSGRELVVAYQAIESYVVGSTVFDYSGAPEHLRVRRQRLGQLDRSTFGKVLKTDRQMESVNEDAYRRGLEAIIQSISKG